MLRKNVPGRCLDTVVLAVDLEEDARDLVSWVLGRVQDGDRLQVLFFLRENGGPDGSTHWDAAWVSHRLQSLTDQFLALRNKSDKDVKVLIWTEVIERSTLPSVLLKEVATTGAQRIVLGSTLNPSTFAHSTLSEGQAQGEGQEGPQSQGSVPGTGGAPSGSHNPGMLLASLAHSLTNDTLLILVQDGRLAAARKGKLPAAHPGSPPTASLAGLASDATCADTDSDDPESTLGSDSARSASTDSIADNGSGAAGFPPKAWYTPGVPAEGSPGARTPGHTDSIFDSSSFSSTSPYLGPPYGHAHSAGGPGGPWGPTGATETHQGYTPGQEQEHSVTSAVNGAANSTVQSAASSTDVAGFGPAGSPCAQEDTAYHGVDVKGAAGGVPEQQGAQAGHNSRSGVPPTIQWYSQMAAEIFKAGLQKTWFDGGEDEAVPKEAVSMDGAGAAKKAEAMKGAGEEIVTVTVEAEACSHAGGHADSAPELTAVVYGSAPTGEVFLRQGGPEQSKGPSNAKRTGGTPLPQSTAEIAHSAVAAGGERHGSDSPTGGSPQAAHAGGPAEEKASPVSRVLASGKFGNPKKGEAVRQSLGAPPGMRPGISSATRSSSYSDRAGSSGSQNIGDTNRSSSGSSSLVRRPAGGAVAFFQGRAASSLSPSFGGTGSLDDWVPETFPDPPLSSNPDTDTDTETESGLAHVRGQGLGHAGDVPLAANPDGAAANRGRDVGRSASRGNISSSSRGYARGTPRAGEAPHDENSPGAGGTPRASPPSHMAPYGATKGGGSAKTQLLSRSLGAVLGEVENGRARGAPQGSEGGGSKAQAQAQVRRQAQTQPAAAEKGQLLGMTAENVAESVPDVTVGFARVALQGPKPEAVACKAGLEWRTPGAPKPSQEGVPEQALPKQPSTTEGVPLAHLPYKPGGFRVSLSDSPPTIPSPPSVKWPSSGAPRASQVPQAAPAQARPDLDAPGAAQSPSPAPSPAPPSLPPRPGSPGRSPSSSPVLKPRTGVTSPVRTGVTSPVRTGVTSPVRTGPRSPVRTGSTSPVHTGATSPVRTGPRSPVRTGSTSPVRTGVTFPIRTGVPSPVRNSPSVPVATLQFHTPMASTPARALPPTNPPLLFLTPPTTPPVPSPLSAPTPPAAAAPVAVSASPSTVAAPPSSPASPSLTPPQPTVAITGAMTVPPPLPSASPSTVTVLGTGTGANPPSLPSAPVDPSPAPASSPPSTQLSNPGPQASATPAVGSTLEAPSPAGSASGAPPAVGSSPTPGLNERLAAIRQNWVANIKSQRRTASPGYTRASAWLLVARDPAEVAAEEEAQRLKEQQQKEQQQQEGRQEEGEGKQQRATEEQQQGQAEGQQQDAKEGQGDGTQQEPPELQQQQQEQAEPEGGSATLEGAAVQAQGTQEPQASADGTALPAEQEFQPSGVPEGMFTHEEGAPEERETGAECQEEGLGSNSAPPEGLCAKGVTQEGSAGVGVERDTDSECQEGLGSTGVPPEGLRAEGVLQEDSAGLGLERVESEAESEGGFAAPRVGERGGRAPSAHQGKAPSLGSPRMRKQLSVRQRRTKAILRTRSFDNPKGPPPGTAGTPGTPQAIAGTAGTPQATAGTSGAPHPEPAPAPVPPASGTPGASNPSDERLTHALGKEEQSEGPTGAPAAPVAHSLDPKDGPSPLPLHHSQGELSFRALEKRGPSGAVPGGVPGPAAAGKRAPAGPALLPGQQAQEGCHVAAAGEHTLGHSGGPGKALGAPGAAGKQNLGLGQQNSSMGQQNSVSEELSFWKECPEDPWGLGGAPDAPEVHQGPRPEGSDSAPVSLWAKTQGTGAQAARAGPGGPAVAGAPGVDPSATSPLVAAHHRDAILTTGHLFDPPVRHGETLVREYGEGAVSWRGQARGIENEKQVGMLPAAAGSSPTAGAATPTTSPAAARAGAEGDNVVWAGGIAWADCSPPELDTPRDASPGAPGSPQVHPATLSYAGVGQAALVEQGPARQAYPDMGPSPGPHTPGTPRAVHPPSPVLAETGTPGAPPGGLGCVPLGAKSAPPKMARDQQRYTEGVAEGAREGDLQPGVHQPAGVGPGQQRPKPSFVQAKARLSKGHAECHVSIQCLPPLWQGAEGAPSGSDDDEDESPRSGAGLKARPRRTGGKPLPLLKSVPCAGGGRRGALGSRQVEEGELRPSLRDIQNRGGGAQGAPKDDLGFLRRSWGGVQSLVGLHGRRQHCAVPDRAVSAYSDQEEEEEEEEEVAEGEGEKGEEETRAGWVKGGEQLGEEARAAAAARWAEEDRVQMERSVRLVWSWMETADFQSSVQGSLMSRVHRSYSGKALGTPGGSVPGGHAPGAPQSSRWGYHRGGHPRSPVETQVLSQSLPQSPLGAPGAHPKHSPLIDTRQGNGSSAEGRPAAEVPLPVTQTPSNSPLRTRRNAARSTQKTPQAAVTKLQEPVTAPTLAERAALEGGKQQGMAARGSLPGSPGYAARGPGQEREAGPGNGGSKTGKRGVGGEDNLPLGWPMQQRAVPRQAQGRPQNQPQHQQQQQPLQHHDDLQMHCGMPEKGQGSAAYVGAAGPGERQEVAWETVCMPHGTMKAESNEAVHPGHATHVASAANTAPAFGPVPKSQSLPSLWGQPEGQAPGAPQDAKRASRGCGAGDDALEGQIAGHQEPVAYQQGGEVMQRGGAEGGNVQGTDSEAEGVTRRLERQSSAPELHKSLDLGLEAGLAGGVPGAAQASPPALAQWERQHHQWKQQNKGQLAWQRRRQAWQKQQWQKWQAMQREQEQWEKEQMGEDRDEGEGHLVRDFQAALRDFDGMSFASAASSDVGGAGGVSHGSGVDRPVELSPGYAACDPIVSSAGGATTGLNVQDSDGGFVQQRRESVESDHWMWERH